MAVQKKDNFAYNLGAMIFYIETKAKTAFEDLPQEDQILWENRGKAAICGIDKLDKMIVRKVDPKDSWALRCKNLDILTSIIEKYVKTLKTTKPDCFPARELAIRIYDGKL